ncbi:MAG: molybdopterin molybdotransferase [Cocleimonas sp.]|jgi:molybdopterin molybdotransferase
MSIDTSNSCDVRQTLMPLDDALVELQSRAITVQETEQVSLNESLGRVLAQDLSSSINVPPADNSAMDGYAIRATDLSNDNTNEFTVSQRICAGEVGNELQPNTVARIFTGAPIPLGADAVVMQENCDYDEVTNKVIIKQLLKSGSNIRKAGEDILSGAIILKAGQKLRAQDIGLAASVGIAEITVKQRLKVAVFFTGDELCDPGKTPKAGQIYNSNRYTLTGLLNSLGCDVIDLGNVEDTLNATISAMQKASEQADLVMTSGGVSVGEEDHVRKALEQLGELNMWRVNIKPGKPFAFGHINTQNKTNQKNTPFIGLPGNPVSVFATFCIFARPYILQTQGMSNTLAHSFKVPSEFELDGKESRNEYLRVRLDISDKGQSVLSVYPNQSSGVLTSASWANGFAFVPANTIVNQGDLIEFTPFSEFSIV